MHKFRLFVMDAEGKSKNIISLISAMCERHFEEGFELAIIDILQTPEFAVEEKIIALPTLIKDCPDPITRLVGNLTDTKSVLANLDIRD